MTNKISGRPKGVKHNKTIKFRCSQNFIDVMDIFFEMSNQKDKSKFYRDAILQAAQKNYKVFADIDLYNMIENEKTDPRPHVK